MPFARITVSKENIELRFKSPSASARVYEFAPTNIRRLRAEFGWFVTGLYIESSVVNYPPCVVFLSSGMKSLVAALEERGFQVERS